MTRRRILLYWKQPSVCACLGLHRLRHSQVGDGHFLSESPPERTYGTLAIQQHRDEEKGQSEGDSGVSGREINRCLDVARPGISQFGGCKMLWTTRLIANLRRPHQI